MQRTPGTRWPLILLFIVGWTIAANNSFLTESTEKTPGFFDSADTIPVFEFYTPVVAENSEIGEQFEIGREPGIRNNPESDQQPESDQKADIGQTPALMEEHTQLAKEAHDQHGRLPVDVVSATLKAQRENDLMQHPQVSAPAQLTRILTTGIEERNIFSEDIVPIPLIELENDGQTASGKPAQEIL